MANVKHNEDVKNEQDLQNLVTGIILQMNKDFTAERIKKLVNRNLKGSEFYNNLSLIAEYVTNTLDILQNSGVLLCNNEIYSKRILP